MIHDLVFNVLPRFRAVGLIPLILLVVWSIDFVSQWWALERREKERRMCDE